MSKRIATLTALAALAVAPALAQGINPAPVNPSTTPAAPNMTRTFLDAQSADQWLATKLIGASVIDNANTSIGSVNDLVLDSSGNVVAAVIGVGGFLGIGEKNVAIAFRSLNITRNQNGAQKVTTEVSKNELQQAAVFKLYEPVRADRPASTNMPIRPKPNM
jgi:sporulation protein YlmC with PRC-barrel domain